MYVGCESVYAGNHLAVSFSLGAHVGDVGLNLQRALILSLLNNFLPPKEAK